jgi:cellobiose phosphorylase
MTGYEFIGNDGTFRLRHAEKYRDLYFPLAGENGLKSCITPQLAGDAKIDQNHFLFPPVSILDLKEGRTGRNFWILPEGEEPWSVSGSTPAQRALSLTDSAEEVEIEAGFMWHRMTRVSDARALQASVTSFIPFDKNVEVHILRVTNLAEEERTFTVLSALPIYGRSADNLRDHRHVTSLLNRIRLTGFGVENRPTLSFDERGHQKADSTYLTEGFEADGTAPVAFYPVLEDYVGSAGDLSWPEAVARFGQAGAYEGVPASADGTDGQEALGAFRFRPVVCGPQQTRTYIILAGICPAEGDFAAVRESLNTEEKAEHELCRTKDYWIRKVNLQISTGDDRRDGILRWISFQPFLRRIFGCSFLPHHDYGRGGRGWRDLWQDCLALLLMQPESVRQLLHSNFAGVRLDGTNATIIGDRPGQFKADRNSITRVWMDHGVWPWMTTLLYLNQTGDWEFLFEESPYFEDGQVMRGRKKQPAQSARLRHLREDGTTLMATNLEHLLLQNLTAADEVGEHGMLQLRDADWNDALDLAGQRGESVAFSAAYADNLLTMARVLARPELSGRELSVTEEIGALLREDPGEASGAEADAERLQNYCNSVLGPVSGRILRISCGNLSGFLKEKGERLLERIRQQEWHETQGGEGWFNSYYDNDGQALDRADAEDPMMMLTGQVFTVASGAATKEQIEKITRAADHRLYDKGCGGYRLNTDFGEVRMNMGRMFGFAYGEKENGAVFSHMAVMYGNALYRRGFGREGFRALGSLMYAAGDFPVSQMYPGLPEYFGRGGKGLYQYLTGAASWYLMTVLTQMYGVRGDGGDLVLHPQLMEKQFDSEGKNCIDFRFAGRSLRLEIRNDNCVTYEEAQIRKALLAGEALEITDGEVHIPRRRIEQLDAARKHRIELELG